MGWKDLEPESKIPTFQLIFCLPEWSHLDVVGRLTPSKNGNHEIYTSPQLEHPTFTNKLEHPNLHKFQHQHNFQLSIQKQHQHHPHIHSTPYINSITHSGSNFTSTLCSSPHHFFTTTQPTTNKAFFSSDRRIFKAYLES
jgi:hypothetical protein